jgi:putative spermidine/putrescine transport system ATP-binding protein
MTSERASRGASLDIVGVTKRYSEVTAVDNVSLSIAPGEFVTFLGPSGSGKTTTLNMVAGFTSVTSGEISVNGKPLSHVPPYKRNLGMVFQHYALFPHMTVFENVAFPLRRRRVSRADVQARVKVALDQVKLQDFAHRYPAQLSGGQQQRVALARAIVFSPPVLLMDEPLGALDRKLRDELQLELRHLHKQLGLTFVFVTHDQEEALTLSDRVAVFNEGRIEQIGSPEQLYDRPRSRFVARFIGESNLIDGKIARGGTLLDDSEGGQQFAVESAGGLEGRTAMLLIRPDRIRVMPVGANIESAQNRLNGKVVHSIFLGVSHRMMIQGEDGRTYVVRRSAADSTTAVAEGQDVVLSWNVRDSLVLSEESANDSDAALPEMAVPDLASGA